LGILFQCIFKKENFNDILLKDNKKKYEKMITQLEKSIEEGKFDVN